MASYFRSALTDSKDDPQKIFYHKGIRWFFTVRAVKLRNDLASEVVGPTKIFKNKDESRRENFIHSYDLWHYPGRASVPVCYLIAVERECIFLHETKLETILKLCRPRDLETKWTILLGNSNKIPWRKTLLELESQILLLAGDCFTACWSNMDNGGKNMNSHGRGGFIGHDMCSLQPSARCNCCTAEVWWLCGTLGNSPTPAQVPVNAVQGSSCIYDSPGYQMPQINCFLPSAVNVTAEATLFLWWCSRRLRHAQLEAVCRSGVRL